MKTRRIFAQPGEPIEIINTYGTSILKIVPMFSNTEPVAVIYPQPNVETFTANGSFELGSSAEPIYPPVAEED